MASTRGRFSGFALAGLLCFLGSAGCHPAPEDAAATPEAPELAALRADFASLVTAARAGDAAGVQKRLDAYVATPAEFETLFGPQRGPQAHAAYLEKVVQGLAAEGGPTLVERVRSGQTEVVIEEVGPAFPARTTPGDHRLLDAFVGRFKLYTVRLHAPEEPLGFRLDGFVRVGPRWVGLFRTFDHLTPEAPSAPDSAAPTSP